MRPPPALFKTPPYVTATPVVTHRKLNFSSDNDKNGAIRFVVLATDGLWDQLTYVFFLPILS
jgi:pyruvate dehydrogenase phosphatase